MQRQFKYMNSTVHDDIHFFDSLPHPCLLIFPTWFSTLKLEGMSATQVAVYNDPSDLSWEYTYHFLGNIPKTLLYDPSDPLFLSFPAPWGFRLVRYSMSNLKEVTQNPRFDFYDPRHFISNFPQDVFGCSTSYNNNIRVTISCPKCWAGDFEGSASMQAERVLYKLHNQMSIIPESVVQAHKLFETGSKIAYLGGS